MPDTSGDENVRAQLRDVEEQIERLRKDSAGLTDQLGGRDQGPSGEEDTAAETTNLEESNAILSLLEQRRETLRSQLADPT